MAEEAITNQSHDLSRTYRSILDAMAHPGQVLPFAPVVTENVGLSSEAAAVAITLCDFQTPIWLAEEFRTSAIEHYLRFHTGAPLTRTASAAAFAFIDSKFGIAELGKFSKGTHEYPDRSATVVIDVQELHNSSGVRLQGPGIECEQYFGAEGLGEDFWQKMIAIHQDFPLGIDVIFSAPRAIAAIPRSTKINLMEII